MTIPSPSLQDDRTLRSRAVDRAAFAPYGEIFAVGDGRPRRVNDGRALRYDGIVRLEHGRDATEPSFALYRIAPVPRPCRIEVLERHPRSTQTFVPMTAQEIVVAVAPEGADGLPRLDALEAFRVGAGVGVHYRAGVWHLPLTVFDAEAVFAMWMWEAGDGRDTVEHRLSHPIFVDP